MSKQYGQNMIIFKLGIVLLRKWRNQMLATMKKLTTLGSRLSMLMDNEGMSARQLAREMNKSPTTISNWTRDEAWPGKNSIAWLARRFRVSENYLVGGECDLNNDEVIEESVAGVKRALRDHGVDVNTLDDRIFARFCSAVIDHARSNQGKPLNELIMEYIERSLLFIDQGSHKK